MISISYNFIPDNRFWDDQGWGLLSWLGRASKVRFLGTGWASLRGKALSLSSGFLALSLVAFASPDAGRDVSKALFEPGVKESSDPLDASLPTLSPLDSPFSGRGTRPGDQPSGEIPAHAPDEGGFADSTDADAPLVELSASPYLLTRNVVPKNGKEEGLKTALEGLGISDREAKEIVAATSRFRGSQSPVPGVEIGVEFNQLTGTVNRFVQPLESDLLIVNRAEDGHGFTVRRESIPYETRIVRVKGQVGSSFSDSARAHGLGKETISDLEDIFGWEMDLGSHLRRGDTFEVVYESKYLDGEWHHTGDILAARISVGDEDHTAFLFKDKKGRGDYFDDTGRSLKQSLTKFPVRYSSISSPFQLSRYHPILHIVRPHDGVDLAAPYGTSVRAAGDGVVEFASWKGEYGRLVVVRHNLVFSSYYGHLSGFAPGIVPGKKVTQGQMLGFVGASGLATGPHLHYGILRNGRFIDPLTLRIPPRKVLKGEELAEYKKHRDEFVAMLSNVVPGHRIAMAAEPKDRSHTIR